MIQVALLLQLTLHVIYYMCVLYDYTLIFLLLRWVLFLACLTEVDRMDILAFPPLSYVGMCLVGHCWEIEIFSKILFTGEIIFYFPIAERVSVLFLICTVLYFVKQFCSFEMIKMLLKIFCCYNKLHLLFFPSI